MAVNYKFKSAKDFDSVAIDGDYISIANLKEKIALKQKLGRATDYDLVISNADTDEEYLEEDFLLYDNASVLVRRVPRVPPRAPISYATRIEWEEEIGELDDVETVATQFAEALHVQAASSCISSDEDVRIKEFVDSSAADWMRQTQESELKGATYQRKPLPTKGVPPMGYVCFRCGVEGHFIQDCPTNGDPLYDVKKMKLPSGIPRTMLVANPDGIYALPTGEVAELKPNEDVFAREIDAVLPVEPVTEIPPELRCPLCDNALKDAVLTSKCCFKSYCDKCIRDVLLEKCTCVCGAKKIYADDLLPNKTLRQTIDRLLSGSALPTVPTTNVISVKPQSQDSTTTQATSSGNKENSADNKKVEVNEETEELDELEEVDYDDEGYDDLNLDAFEGEESAKTPESTVAKASEAEEQKSPVEAKESKDERTSVPDPKMEVVNATKPANGSPDRGKAGSQARGSVPPYAVHYTGYWSASHMIGEMGRPRYGLNAFFPRVPFSSCGHYPYQAKPYALGNPAPQRLLSREEFEARKAMLKRKRGFYRDESDKDFRERRSGSPYRQRSRSPLRYRPRSNSPGKRRRDSGSPHSLRRRSTSPPSYRRRSMSPVRKDRIRAGSSYAPVRSRPSPNSRSPQGQSQYRAADDQSPQKQPRFREKASPQRYPARYSSRSESREDKENTWRRAANGRYPDGYAAKADRISPRRRDYEPEMVPDRELVVRRVPGKNGRYYLQRGAMSPEAQPGFNFGIRVRPDDREEEPMRQVVRKPVQRQEMSDRYEDWDSASASERYQIRKSVPRLGRSDSLQQKRAGYTDSFENDAYNRRIQLVEETERPTRTLLRGARSVSDCDDLDGFMDDRMVAPLRGVGVQNGFMNDRMVAPLRGAGVQRSMVLLPPRDDNLLPPPLLREQRLKKAVFRRPDGPGTYSSVVEDDEDDEMLVVERAALMEQQETAAAMSRRKLVKRVSLVKDRITVQVGGNKQRGGALLMEEVDNIVVQKRPRAVFLNSDDEEEQEVHQQKLQIQQPVVQANLIVNRAKRLKAAAAATAPGGVKLMTKSKLCKISPMVKSVFERISFNNTTPNRMKKTFKAGGGGAAGAGVIGNGGATERVVVFYGDMS